VRTWVLAVSSFCGLAALALLDSGAAVELLRRIVPVLGFVAAMSVVVNAAQSVRTFEGLIGHLQSLLGLSGGRGGGSPVRAWALIFGISLVVTVFFSLDTTAILITPLVIAIARGSGLNTLAAAFAVVWMANLGSMLLPISNLTNLLAVETGHFAGLGDYVSLSWLPALVLAMIAVLAPLVFRQGRSPLTDTTTVPLSPESRRFAGLIGVLLVLLLTPLPVWAPTTAAALVAVLHLRSLGLPTPVHRMIPWSTLFFAFSLSAAAALVHALGLLDPVLVALADRGPFTLAFAGALLSNAGNNIPAYLALEPAAATPSDLMALLIGVNAGPIVTPWASLATLLWADQARRHGVEIRWSTFMFAGLVIAPLAIVAATASLLLLH